MASKKQIKQTLNQYFSIKDIQEVAKFWDADDPEDTSSYEVVIEELQKAIDKIQSLKDKKLKKFKELYFKCPGCKKLSLYKDVKEVSRKEFRIETTYTDSGYGDDDRTGKVWYLNFYRVCPHCNKETFKDRHFLNIEEEYTRYGDVIK